jgi:hypothetical protein
MKKTPFAKLMAGRSFCMKKNEKNTEDNEQVIGFEGPGKVVNFFDPYPDEDEKNVNNSDTVDNHPSEKQ